MASLSLSLTHIRTAQSRSLLDCVDKGVLIDESVIRKVKTIDFEQATAMADLELATTKPTTTTVKQTEQSTNSTSTTNTATSKEEDYAISPSKPKPPAPPPPPPRNINERVDREVKTYLTDPIAWKLLQERAAKYEMEERAHREVVQQELKVDFVQANLDVDYEKRQAEKVSHDIHRKRTKSSPLVYTL